MIAVRCRKCCTKFCRRRARKHRHYCCTCIDRKWRVSRPMRYLYKNLKHHARERGWSFELSYEEWEEFCRETNYHILKGREPDALTVERMDETKGYTRKNMTVLRHCENVRRKFVPFFRRQAGALLPAAGTVTPDNGEAPW